MPSASFPDELLERVGIVPSTGGPKADILVNDFPLLHGQTEGVAVLVQMLRHPNPQVREIVARGLQEVASSGGDITPALKELRRALRDEDDNVCQQARQALRRALPDFKE